MNGWMGQILRINLTHKTSSIEELPNKTKADFLGGRGLGVKYLYDEVGAEVKPLSSENKLIFAVGPLTGTGVPTASQYSLTTKSPLTGTVFNATSGGAWGVKFKKCGFDALIIEGRADQPVYIAIKDGKIEIKEAKELWGKDVSETNRQLLEIEGNESSVACIGPAGENLVKLSTIVNDKANLLGRGGVGAVMGSKNLKAIVVQGSKSVQIADKEKLDFIVYEANKWINANPITAIGLPEFGNLFLVNIINDSGILPVKNFQESQLEDADKISGETVAEQTLDKSGCHECNINCKGSIKVNDKIVGCPDYESLWALGPQCGINDLETILEAVSQCVSLGLDPISTGSTIGCLMEMRQRGLVKEEIDFGNQEKLGSYIKSMAYREGIGNRIAEGSRDFSRNYGGEEYAMQVKGLELPAYDPRGVQGMGLTFATSNQGGCQKSAYMIAPEILGVPKMVDRFSYAGKAGLTIFYQNLHASMDALLLCRSVGFAISEEYFARMLSAVTGINYQPQNLHIIGERIWNLEKLYNLREGFTSKDDNLPERLLTEPIKEGPAQGMVVHLEYMLKEYYRFRGWDAFGIPTEKKLQALEMEGYHA